MCVLYVLSAVSEFFFNPKETTHIRLESHTQKTMHPIFSQRYHNYQQVLFLNTGEFTWEIASQVIILSFNSDPKM